MKVLKEHYEKIIMKKINDNGGNANVPEDIWDNLSHLASKASNYDEEVYYLPLQIKKMLAYILDPSYRIEYNVNKTENYCEVEARMYWNSSDLIAGIGFKKIYVNQIRRSDMITVEERESALEATCRGCAASRALTDAGIGMEFYGDCFEFDFEKKEAEEKLEEKEKEKIPEIPSAEEKKAAYYNKKANATTTLPPVEEKQEETPAPAIEEPKAEAVTETHSSISVEDAKKAIVDIGTYAGNDLGTVLAVMPRNLIWLIKQNSAVKEEAKVLVETLPELKKYL